MSAVCGLRFTDLRQVAFSCKQRFQFLSIAKNKATKQSRDLSVFMFYSLLITLTTHREAIRLWLNENAMLPYHSNSKVNEQDLSAQGTTVS